MDFNILSWHERHYKKVILITIILFSAAVAGYYYHQREFNHDYTFVVSILYALFLFVIGIYHTCMTSKSKNFLYERADTYVKIKRAIEVMERFEGCVSFVSVVESFIQLTARDNTPEHQRRWCIPLSSATADYITRIENDYINRNTTLCSVLSSIINRYVKNNSIIVHRNTTVKIGDHTFASTSEAIIKDALAFSIESWCDNQLVNKSDKRKLVNFYYKEVRSIRNEIDELCQLKTKLTLEYGRYLKQLKLNIVCLEKLYGKQIEYESNRLFEVSDGLADVVRELDSAKREVLDGLSDSVEMTEILIKTSQDLAESIEELSGEIDALKEDDE